MSFVTPAFLYALGLLAIPIIIHLFNFRKYRRVYFTNVALLQEVKEQTKSASRLKNLLLLVCRLLAVAALVIAFAQPFIGPKLGNRQQSETVALYLDNSPSMSIKGSDGKLLNSAQNKAKAIVNAFPDNTAFIVNNNDNEQRYLRMLTKTEALDAIDFTKESFATKTLSDANKKITGIANERKTLSFLLSDFQKNSSNFDDLLQDSSKQFVLVPIAAKKLENVAIDSVWFSSPTHLLNANEELNVSLKNFGSNPVESFTVELYQDNKAITLGNVSIPANGSAQLKLNYINRNAGFKYCEVRIQDSPILFDNNFYFAYEVKQKLQVVELQGATASSALNRLFEGDEDYSYRIFTEKNIDYTALKSAGTLFVNGVNTLSSGLINVIKEKLQNGESVAVFPPTNNIDLNSYNALFATLGMKAIGKADTAKTKVNKLEAKHPFFSNLFDKIPQNLDLPSIALHYPALGGKNALSQSLYKLQNGSDYLNITPFKSGNFFWCASPLNEATGNFTQHGLFVPSILRIAESSGYLQQLSFTIGSKQAIKLNGVNLPTAENLIKLVNLDKKTELIPLLRKNNEQVLLFPQGQGIVPGNYQIQSKDGIVIGAIGFNLSREESELIYTENERLKTIVNESDGKLSLMDESPAKITSLVKDAFEGKKLWKWFILAALLFLTLEILLSKWLK